MLKKIKSQTSDLWYYDHSSDEKNRYTLGIPGKNPLICIGVNPSTAEPDNLDATLKRVQKRSHIEGFDGWIMLNVFPLRETKPNKLPQQGNQTEIDKNTKIICQVMRTYPDCKVWAAWGNSVDLRPYLLQSLYNIYTETKGLDLNWVTVKLCKKSGHPHHPIGLRYIDSLQSFDMQKYFEDRGLNVGVF